MAPKATTCSPRIIDEAEFQKPDGHVDSIPALDAQNLIIIDESGLPKPDAHIDSIPKPKGDPEMIPSKKFSRTKHLPLGDPVGELLNFTNFKLTDHVGRYLRQKACPLDSLTNNNLKNKFSHVFGSEPRNVMDAVQTFCSPYGSS